MFVETANLRKPVEYGEARRLRREEGMAMKRIAARLGVSLGTVHRWTQDIELTPKQRARNMGRNRPGQPGWVLTAGRMRKARAARLQYQREGRARARQGDPLHMAGCMLYWAEGAKGRNAVDLANSDLALVRFFCRFLRTCLGVAAADFRIKLNVYTSNGLSIEEIERHWLEALELPRSCVIKHTLNHTPTSSSGGRKNKLPYGVCSVRVHSTHIVQHIYGAIQEYAGFEEPRWLD
jgi:AcrR family transcriptional regulator